MNYSTAILLVSEDVRIVKVSYNPDEITYDKEGNYKSGTLYAFKTFDKNLKTGDYVIVPTNTRHEYTVGKVEIDDVEVDDFIDSSLNMKWIVDTVDLTGYNAIVGQEQDAIKTIQSAEKRRKRKEMMEAITADLEEKEKEALLLLGNNKD